MRPRLLCFLSAGLLTALLPVAMRAQVVLINDSFTDGTRLDGADPQDTSWFMSHPDLNLGGTAPTIGTDNNTPLSGNALGFSGTSTFAYGIGAFASTTLSAPGASITISMDFAVQGSTSAGALSGPILGLFGNGGTPLGNDINSITGQATHNDAGYELIYERGISGNLFLVPIDNSAFTSDFAYGTRTPALSWALGLVTSDTGGHTMSLTLTLAPNGIDLIVVPKLDSYVGSAQTLSGASVLTTVFNEALVSTWSGSGSGAVDNISVVTAVPEPSTYAALTGALALGWAAWRRRIARGCA